MLRGDHCSSPFEGWGSTSQGYWTSAADEFDKNISDLARQKSELTQQEALAEMAALGTDTEARLL